MSKDKKQLLVVGVLGLAMLTVGAFQFLAPKGPAAVAPNPKDTDGESASTEIAKGSTAEPIDPIEHMLNELLGPVQPRDPFLAQAIILDPPDPKRTDTVDRPEPSRRDEFAGGPGYGPLNPNGNGTVLAAGAPLRQPGEFAYKLKGVLVGANRNVAVFEDDSGYQRLVGEGDTFGSADETVVISINAEGVTIRHGGKTKTLKVEQG